MPHITVKMVTGRSDAQKHALTEAITKAVMEHAGSSEAAVSVAIEDVAKDDWNTRVYDTEIAPVMDKLYRKPGYKRS
jgi:4-oxalocrotonate tautomerase